MKIAERTTVQKNITQITPDHHAYSVARAGADHPQPGVGSLMG